MKVAKATDSDAVHNRYGVKQRGANRCAQLSAALTDIAALLLRLTDERGAACGAS
jgi:uncharacterized protein YqgC (DUF456 family)